MVGLLHPRPAAPAPDPALIPFLSENALDDLTARRTAIADLCGRGFGTAISPWGQMFGRFGERHSRPATHCHEIDLFGVHASGETIDQAVTNWFTVAGRIAGGNA